jgi:hypothetical protein
LTKIGPHTSSSVTLTWRADNALDDREPPQTTVFRPHRNAPVPLDVMRWLGRYAPSSLNVAMASINMPSVAQGETKIGEFGLSATGVHGPLAHTAAVEIVSAPRSRHWFNPRRLLEPIGCLPPAEYEARYYEQAAVA